MYKKASRFITLLTILSVTLFTSSVNVLAASQEITKSDLVNNTKDSAVPVECTISSAFSVKLPSEMQLENSNGEGTYSNSVGVKGDIDAGKAVTVEPEATVTLYDVTSRPTDDLPENEDDQNYPHKDAKVLTVEQAKTVWEQTEIEVNGYKNTDLEATVSDLSSGKWKGSLNVNVSYKNSPTVFKEGTTYIFAGYKWVAAEVKENYTVLQSTGVTAGGWPGYTMAKFGNGANYSDHINDRDISDYDAKTTELYNNIKSVEYTEATNGTGLYLVSHDMAGITGTGAPGSGNYWSALTIAANNYNKLGAGYNKTWTGSFYGWGGSYAISSDGTFETNYQNLSMVIAPAFNIDTSKVTINGTIITIN